FWGALRIAEAPSPEIKLAMTIRPAKLRCIIVFSRPFDIDLTWDRAREVPRLLSVSTTRQTVNVLQKLNLAHIQPNIQGSPSFSTPSARVRPIRGARLVPVALAQ